jgi:1-acyl-sn-glycerol-3-phosphate acyltransferase
MNKPRLFYSLLKLYAHLGTLLFYRRLKVNNLKNVPTDGPLIFVPNHQNAFMDAIVTTVVSPRNPWFLTRASVFGSATARYWLNLLQMIPIYRFRDGLQNVKKNDETMEMSLNILKDEGTILIFAEGNHDYRWSLRPLQKGLARMSFAFESPSDFTSGLQIVPVGLQYENHNQFRSDLLINFGEPIKVSDYKEIYQSDPIRATNKLLEDVSQNLGSLILNIGDIEMHDKIKSAIKSRVGRESDLLIRLQSDQGFIKDGKFLIKKQRGSNVLLGIIGFPVFLYGAINNLIIFLIIKYIMKKFIKDAHWTASIKFAGMILLSPVIYLLQTIVIWLYFPDWACVSAYFLSLPLSAVLAGDYFHSVLKH